MTRPQVILLLPIALLAACEPSEFRPIPVGGGGGGYDAPVRPAPARQQPARQQRTTRQTRQQYQRPHPMLRDPDARIETDRDYVWAFDDQDAASKCRWMAKNRGGEYSHIEGGTGRANKAGKKRYTCVYTYEGEVRYDDDR
jgi:hypothetical protein